MGYILPTVESKAALTYLLRGVNEFSSQSKNNYIIQFIYSLKSPCTTFILFIY